MNRIHYLRTGIFFGLALLQGCAMKPEPTFEVRHWGEMRSVMREGKTEARIQFAQAAGAGVVAVGALEKLGGEITMLGGETWVARTDSKEVSMAGPLASKHDQATLLTRAVVPQWKRVDLPLTKPTSGARLESYLEESASQHGIDTTQPFPFVIEGTLEKLDIHVINGHCPHTSHASHEHGEDIQPWRWSMTQPGFARVVGFYAENKSGVMTHHGTKIHAHALVEVDQRTITGHIDGMVVQPGAALLLPDQK